MSLNAAVETMMEVPLFRNVDPKRLRVFAFMGETLTFRAGERLFEKGDDGDAAFVVIAGEVEVRVPVDAGETVVAVLGAKEIFGEMAVLCNEKRSTAITARSDVQVLRLNRAALVSMLREFPDIALEMIKVLAGRLRETTAQLAAAQN